MQRFGFADVLWVELMLDDLRESAAQASRARPQELRA